MVKARGLPIITKDQLLDKVRTMAEPRTASLVVMAYLTAARVNELLIMKRKHIARKGDYFVIRMKVSKKYDILKKILLEDNTKKFVIQERLEVRNVPINIKRDKELLKLAMPWIRSRPKNAKIWPICRQYAWKLMNKYDLMPHYLRHLRLTHLVTNRNFTDQDLVQFTGWADSKPASIYTHLRWQDVARKL